jgi:hypothetical protein
MTTGQLAQMKADTCSLDWLMSYASQLIKSFDVLKTT